MKKEIVKRKRTKHSDIIKVYKAIIYPQYKKINNRKSTIKAKE
jgi:hypothetical protein